jgi:septal ring factor EnvC (AmiA/AmiB activator)
LMAQGFEERATRLDSDIRDSQKRATELEAKVGAPFEHEQRYHELSKRQSDIEEKLDLTKNQASSQLEASENAETNAVNEQPDETRHQTVKPKTGIRV